MAKDRRGRTPGPGARDGQAGREDPYADERPFVFPRWTNRLRLITALAVGGGLLYLTVVTALFFDPATTAVGYAPVQPVPYSHALHVGQLGMDCRYCHTTVERAATAALPSTEMCLNCHRHVRAESPRLLPVRESLTTGLPVAWVRIHDLPDFAYFDHSPHLAAGVGCVSCHGRIDQMDVVQQARPLSMGWCLGCHRDPDPNLRPPEFVTSMAWTPDGDPRELGRRLRQERGIDPGTDCSICHR